VHVLTVSSPGRPDKPNEDFAAISPGAAVLLDGAGMLPEVETGCAHGVAWYARRLGAAILAEITAGPRCSLREALGQAIALVRAQHDTTCDLSNPATPGATVTVVRRASSAIDFLVLSDSIIAADFGGDREPVIVTDHRPADQGGLARADEHAADRALTGSIPLARLRNVALLSDGAARLVELFGLQTWPDLLAVLRAAGPAGLLSQVRAAEAADPDRARWPRVKVSDDATVIYWRLAE
jgi:protein phosphatase 2C-like protein